MPNYTWKEDDGYALSHGFHWAKHPMTEKTLPTRALYRNAKYTAVAIEKLRCQNLLTSVVKVRAKSNHSTAEDDYQPLEDFIADIHTPDEATTP